MVLFFGVLVNHVVPIAVRNVGLHVNLTVIQTPVNMVVGTSTLFIQLLKQSNQQMPQTKQITIQKLAAGYIAMGINRGQILRAGLPHFYIIC